MPKFEKIVGKAPLLKMRSGVHLPTRKERDKSRDHARKTKHRNRQDEA